jgi:hypothetical protein
VRRADLIICVGAGVLRSFEGIGGGLSEQILDLLFVCSKPLHEEELSEAVVRRVSFWRGNT